MFFFFQAEDGIRDIGVTGVQTCALPIYARKLLDEIRLRGYDGGYSQLKLAVTPWREEGHERAFVRFETGPGEHYGKSRVMVRGVGDLRWFRPYHCDLSILLFP